MCAESLRNFDADDATVRVPYWLAQPHRDALVDAVETALRTGQVHPEVQDTLAAVLTELQVTAARDLVWPVPNQRVRIANRYAPDMMPVRLSTNERDAVLSLRLPLAVRAAFHDG